MPNLGRDKMNDLEFIKAYKDMKSISEICDEFKINYTNLIYGKTTSENEEKVANSLKMEVLKIYALLKMKLEEK